MSPLLRGHLNDNIDGVGPQMLLPDTPVTQYRCVDLFAGIGGIRRAFELTGRFRNVLSAEIDEHACQTYRHLFGENPHNDATSNEFKRKVSATPYDVLLAGFPCQAFSIAGRKEGFRDKTRGTLFFDVADILDRTRPKAFLLENVEGLVRHNRGETFGTILETLTIELKYHIPGVTNDQSTGGLCYEPREFIRNSRDFGVPQNRPRTYLVGFSTMFYGEKVQTIPLRRLPESRKGSPIYESLDSLLELGAPPEYYLSRGYLETLRKHRVRHRAKGNGFGFVVVNTRSTNPQVSNAVLAVGGSGKERNLVYDPQSGIADLQWKGKKSPINAEGIRVMTPREWSKLQGFLGYAFVRDGEEHFSFPASVSKAQQYKQLGNAVTIPVAEVFAYEIARCLDYLGDGRNPERDDREEA